MPLAFHPGPGAILICDFSTGFSPPEMVKARPVIVISPRRRTSAGLATVVPLSSTAPQQLEPWHYELPSGCYPPARASMWAKCDMVATVGLQRLDRVMVRLGGKRTYQVFQLPNAELASVMAAVKAGLGLR